MSRRLFALFSILSLFLLQMTVTLAEDIYDPKTFEDGGYTYEELQKSGPQKDAEIADAADQDEPARLGPGEEINFLPIIDGAEKTSFSNYSQLKSMCAKSYSSAVTAFCTMKDSEFVISQDITIPVNLTVVFGVQEISDISYREIKTPVRIPGGVTVTLKGRLGVNDLTVDGKMIIENGADLSDYQGDCYLTVNGSVINSGHISVDGVTGIDYIEQKSLVSSYLYVNKRCSTMDELMNLLDYANHHGWIGGGYMIYYSGYADFSEDIIIDSHINLYLQGDGIIRKGARMTVRGELDVGSYFSSACLTVEGELKNKRQIILRKEDTGSCGSLKLANGGRYLGKGVILLRSYKGTLNPGEMLQGFNLSEFSESENGSFTQFQLKDYTESWEDGEISSFQELKEMIESGGSDDILSYTGPNPLVIEEDLSLYWLQSMHIYPTDVIVPEGVTFTVSGFFSCHNLTIYGTMNAYSTIQRGTGESTEFSRANPSTVTVEGDLNLYGESIGESNTFVPANLATAYLYGEENVHRLGEGKNMVYLIRECISEEEIRDVLYDAQSDHTDWKEYCPTTFADITLTDNLVIPRNCSLDPNAGTITVPEGIDLTVYGGMDMYGGKLNVQGSLVNEGEIKSFRDGEEQIRLRDDSCYSGNGVVDVRNSKIDTLLPGFDLSKYYQFVDGSRVILTRSKEVYDALEAGSEMAENIYYQATASVTYHQTEARKMLDYVNDFRTGDEANYMGLDGEIVSLVGQLEPLEYSYSLEEIAMQRAAEIAVYFNGEHLRPNGQRFSSAISSDGKHPDSENIASSSSTEAASYDFYMNFREEGEDYSCQGHRRNMLDANHQYMGAGFAEYCGLRFFVQEFGSRTGTGDVRPAENGTVVTVIEVSSGKVYSYNNVKAEPDTVALAPEESTEYPSVSAELFVVSDFFINTDSPVCTLTPEWTVEDTGIAEIRDGKIYAVRDGETELTANVFEQEIRVPVIVSSSGLQKPVITQQPKSLNLNLGDDMLLQVGASGTALKYQWYYRVKEGADWKKFDSEENSGTLELKASADYNNCDFRCTVSNAAGSVTSNTVHVSIAAELNKHSLLLPFFRTESLRLPQAEGTDEYIYWTSSDPKVLTVTHDGTVKPHDFGTATVTASLGDGRITDTCKVSVVFSDVSNKSDYYYNHVYWAMDHGITNGYSSGPYAGKFGVGLSCTREDMMTFLWRMAGKPEPKTTVNPFSDVKSSAYYYKAVLWGVENGITKGYSSGPYAGKFGVGLDCNREHAMTFLWRLAGNPEPRTLSNKFKDVRSSDYFFKAVLWASENGIANGYSSGTYAGKYGVGLACLREHMVTFLSRYDSKF